MAKEAACGWLFGEVEAGNKLPDATPRNELEEVEGGFINMLLLDLDEYRQKRGVKAVKKTLTIPEWLNTRATQEGVNFSKVLQEALKQELGIA